MLSGEAWRRRAASIGWGALGVLVALLLWHTWTDHVAFHAIVNMINQNAAQAAQRAAPVATAPTP